MKFKVTISSLESVLAEIEVEATSEAEAAEMALKLAQRGDSAINWKPAAGEDDDFQIEEIQELS